MAPKEVPEDARESGTVYFCYEYAADSFSGVLVEEYTLTDEQLKEYIRYDNPKLYQRLQCLPFASSDVPLSYHAQRQLKKAHEMQQGIDAKRGFRQAPTEHAYETSDATPQGSHVLNDQVNCTLLELQLKRYVQMNLLNGYSLLLRRLPSHSNPCFCNSPTCAFGNLILPDTSYVTLKRNMFPNGYTGLSEVCNETYYCLSCLEGIFDGGRRSTNNDLEQMIGTKTDGICQDMVIDAASRLYHASEFEQIHTVASVEPQTPETKSDSSPEIPLELRLKKKHEIEATLNEIKKFERCRTRSQESVHDIDTIMSPNLHITRPIYMEAAKDRYKKQGLGAWDRVVALRDSQSPPLPVPSTTSNLDITVHLLCYCREQDSGTEAMIKCNNDWCSIGWFHARCVNRESENPDHEHFLCNYCREDYGPFGRVSEDDMMDNITATNDTILDEADQLIDEDDEDAETSYDTDQDLDEDNDLTHTSTAAHWGTPINIRNASIQCKPTDYLAESPPTTPTKQTKQFDGTLLTPISPFRSPTRTLTSSPSKTVRNPLPYHDPLARSLFPGSSHTTFSDLAPFITTADLSAREIEVFESWKFNQSPSRLVKALMKRNGWVSDTVTGADTNNEDDSEDSDGASCTGRCGTEKSDPRESSCENDGGDSHDQEKRLSQLLDELST